MTRQDIVDRFRQENSEITTNVISDTVLKSWCVIGDKEVCARARCIVDQDGTTISTTEDDEYYDLTAEISDFFDIDFFPGSGVTYNGKRLKKTTMAALDEECPTWRSRSSGTPKKYYVRGKYLYLDRPIDDNEYDIKVYAVLISDDFDNDTKTPFNELTYLEPFHYSMVLYLVWRAKGKIGKREDALKAKAEFEDYIAWMKKELAGAKYGTIHLARKDYPTHRR